jgi:hypothetical protein
MKSMAIALNEAELIRLRRIITDEDQAEALDFLKDTMEAKVKESELPHCVPVFEVTYHPKQGEAFKDS